MLLFCAFSSVSAQEFFPVEGVKQTGQAFFVLASSNKAVQVNPVVYKQVKKNPSDFVVAYYEGKEENFLTVARRADIKRVVCEVDSVGFGTNEEISKVFFTDGTSYEDDDADLLTLQKGQKLELTSVQGLTQNLWRHRTVPRDTPVSKNVDVLAAVAE